MATIISLIINNTLGMVNNITMNNLSLVIANPDGTFSNLKCQISGVDYQLQGHEMMCG